MKRAAIFTAVLLLGSAFAFAGAASAEDIDECQEESTPAGPAEVCVADSTDGDSDEACDPEGSGTYEGETGASASVGEEAPGADAEAGGEETCEHTCTTWSCSYDESERIFADASVCLEGSFFCTAGAEAAVVWDQDGVDALFLEGVSVFTPAGSVDAGAQWTESFNGNTTDVRVSFCGPQGFCQPSGGADAGWDEDAIDAGADVCLQSGFIGCDVGAGADAFWGEDWQGECSTELSVFAPADGPDDVEEGCPAGSPPAAPGAPGSPNPGWGQVTPDAPDMLEESLPE